MKKQKVLFVCTHNSSRSQMAEGLLHTYYGDRYDVYSAGTQPSGVNRFAIEAMEDREELWVQTKRTFCQRCIGTNPASRPCRVVLKDVR